MKANATFVICIGLFTAAGTVLVVTEHYGWAWIPWLAMLTLSVKD